MHKISRLRKITSIVLAVLIAFSCVAVGVSAASTDTVKVAFTNNYDWENVYIYAYGTNNDGLMGNWPGRRLTISEDNGLGHRNYYTEVPKNTYGIVFNNGSNEKQTVDIAFSGNTTGWWVDGIASNGKYTVQEWNYQPNAPTPEPTTAPEGYLRAVFTNNNNWSSVHAYGWDADGVVTLGDWPGKAMTNLGDNGYGHDNYEVFVPASTVGIVFSDENGQQQTVDIEFEPNKGWYLDGGQNSGLYTVASWDYVEPTTATQGTTVEPTTEVIPDGTVKIVFTNNENWPVVKAFAWDKSNHHLTGDWPGITMAKMGTNSYGYDNYYAYVPENATGIVFSDGGDNQTVDIPFEANKGWYITGQQDGLYTVNSWNLVEEPTSEPEETTVPAGTKMYFANSKGWASVFAYAWDKDDNPLLGDWAGTAMSKVGSVTGVDVYAITVPAGAKAIVFSGGNDQTVDVVMDGTSKAYYPSKKDKDGNWEVAEFTYTEPTTAQTDTTIVTTIIQDTTATEPNETTIEPTSSVVVEPTSTVVVEPTTKTDSEPIYIANFAPSSYSLSLKDSIAINFRVKAETVHGYTDPYLVVTMNGQETVINDYETLSDGTLVFQFDKIYPQTVIDDASAVLHGFKGDQEYYGDAYTKSVLEYARNNQTKVGNPNSLKGLLVNLLRYAAEAQKYIHYKEGTLASAEIVSGAARFAKNELKDEELADVRNLHAVALDGTPTSEFTTVSLVLGNTVGIKVTFTADNITNKSIRVDFNGETQYFSGADLVLDDNQPGKASFTYSLYANQLKDTVRFTVCEGDDHTPISDTMTYSAASYAGKYINNPNFGPLLRAMMLYGKAAEEFAAA
ncbi:MAG: starch-binding protein [Ruminococcus sp.]|nr:starch-binding protein [Ruminococcus sp.]